VGVKSKLGDRGEEEESEGIVFEMMLMVGEGTMTLLGEGNDAAEFRVLTRKLKRIDSRY